MVGSRRGIQTLGHGAASDVCGGREHLVRCQVDERVDGRKLTCSVGARAGSGLVERAERSVRSGRGTTIRSIAIHALSIAEVSLIVYAHIG